jgi:hypothetical protein
MTGEQNKEGHTALCWAVATPPELKALRAIRELNRLVEQAPFPIFSNRESTEWVIGTGVGQISMAAGIGYLAGVLPRGATAVWGNIGIAGTQQREIGTALAIHQVECAVTGMRFHPGLIPIRGLDTAVCRTVHKVERAYAKDVLYDMEAAGFVQALRKLTHIDGFGLLKIVSDNRERGVEHLNAKIMKQLVVNAASSINALANNLLKISVEVHRRTAEPPHFEQAIEMHAFSVSEQIRLRKLLRRWSVLKPQVDLIETLGQYTRSKVLDGIEAVLDEVPLEVSHD